MNKKIFPLLLVFLIVVTCGCTSNSHLYSDVSDITPISNNCTNEQISSENEENSSEPTNEKLLDVACIMQTSELISGCELVSLAIVYQYYGIPVSEIQIADDYTPYTSDINTGFVGNPRKNNGMGCMPTVLYNISQRVLADKGLIEKYAPCCIENQDFNCLYKYIDDGDPVVFWATWGMEPHGRQVCWDTGGYYIHEHCLVLTGYDIQNGIVHVSDPQKGNVSYTISAVIESYNSVGRHAFVLRKEEN